jgi:hypothetical protein
MGSHGYGNEEDEEGYDEEHSDEYTPAEQNMRPMRLSPKISGSRFGVQRQYWIRKCC